MTKKTTTTTTTNSTLTVHIRTVMVVAQVIQKLFYYKILRRLTMHIITTTFKTILLEYATTFVPAVWSNFESISKTLVFHFHFFCMTRAIRHHPLRNETKHNTMHIISIFIIMLRSGFCYKSQEGECYRSEPNKNNIAIFSSFCFILLLN